MLEIKTTLQLSNTKTSNIDNLDPTNKKGVTETGSKCLDKKLISKAQIGLPVNLYIFFNNKHYFKLIFMWKIFKKVNFKKINYDSASGNIDSQVRFSK